MKCSQAIQTQLGLVTSIAEPSTNQGRSGCQCNTELPEEYLKPDICDDCAKTGIVRDFLDSDPSVKFNIIRDWRANRLAQKSKLLKLEPEKQDEASQTDPRTFTDISSVTQSGSKKPMLKIERSKLGLEDRLNDTDPEKLSPILQTTPQATATEAVAWEHTSESTLWDVRVVDGTRKLKSRSAALSERLHILTMKIKDKRAFQMNVVA